MGVSRIGLALHTKKLSLARSLVRSFVCRSHALAGESFKSPPSLPSLRCSPSLPLPLYPWKIFKAVWGTYMG